VYPQPPRSSGVTYAFSNNPDLREQYVNPWGRVRIGRVIEDLDALAGNIAHSHCSGDGADVSSMMLVTASIDRMVLKRTVDVERDASLIGVVSYVGNSSMEIKLDANSDGSDSPWLTAYFTFVAVNKLTGKAQRINPLFPDSKQAQHMFELGKTRVQKVGSQYFGSLSINLT